MLFTFIILLLFLGSTTICAASFDPDTGILDITNIGDSQLIVVRNGAVALEIPPGTFAFNAPFQIGFGMYGEPQGEIKEQSIEKSLSLDRGDLVIIATDGLFDNVYLEDICKAVISSQEQIDTAAKADSPESAASALKRIAKKLALKAQRQGNDPAYFSPFAKEAIESGNAPDYYIGG